MSLRLYPLPTLFDADVATLKAATSVTTSGFYLRRPFSVPWSADPTVFVRETTEPGAQHTIIVNATETFTIIPGAEVISIAIQLVQAPITSTSVLMNSSLQPPLPRPQLKHGFGL